MDKWRYFKDNVGLHRFMIVHDDEPLNPRKDQDNMGIMNLWWSRYSLGDNECKGNSDDMLSELIRENVPKEVLIKKALGGEFHVPDYKWNEEEKCYTEPAASGGYYLINSDDELVDEILCMMSANEKRMLLQYYIVLLPCFIYEHSGITISCSNDSYPFNDRWDSGMAGFIYATKGMYCKWMDLKDVDDKKFRDHAREILVAEVKEYDMYLTGDCYGYKEELYKEDMDEWEEINCVWSFLTDKYGDALVEFFKEEMTSKDTPLISEEDAMDMARQMHEEYMTMDQANTIVAI